MPVGIIVDISAVVVGGIIGTFLSKHISTELKHNLFKIFALAAIALGVVSIVKVDNIIIVVLSLIVGSIIGELLNIDGKVRNLIKKLVDKFSHGKSHMSEEAIMEITLAATIFCFSGTAIFGVLMEGINGDSTILLSKSILDICTSAIFAASVGIAISLIAVPQALIYFSLFFIAQLIQPWMNDAVIGNFQAVGGLIIVALGFQLLNLGGFKAMNYLPSMVFVIIFTILAQFVGI